MKLLGLLISFLTLGAVPLAVAQNRIPITGVQVDSNAGVVPIRKNIEDLQAQGGPQWDLYVRALKAMFDTSASNSLSYFQISGIHGRPFIEWNEGGGRRNDAWLGYCPHSEDLFLPWHRAYLLLFEQTLVDHAKRIAKEYPQRYRSDYTRAAEGLRAPYWDWASNSEVPHVSTLQRIQINMPNGNNLKLTEIGNPMYTYKFPDSALRGDYGPFDQQQRKQMYRCSSPRSYPGTANSNMRKRPYKEWTYDALTYSKTFSEFSSTGEGGVSLEQIHNGVHWDAGCGGQFLNAEFTAFDPLFMLHHCNVDRLWAYWQALNPNETVFTGTYAGKPRYSTPDRTTISPKSPLNPFYRTKEAFHTTESVTSIKGFGYSYQGLENSKWSSNQVKTNVKKIINDLYRYDDNDDSSSRLVRRDEEKTRYFVTVQLDVTQVERPCSVDVYLDGEHAGSLVVMAQPPYGTIHGSFAIDKVVEKKGMHYLATDEAVDKIESALDVKIVKGSDGSEIPADSVPSLEIDLEDVNVVLPKSNDQLPQYSEARRRPAYGQKKIKDNGCR